MVKTLSDYGIPEGTHYAECSNCGEEGQCLARPDAGQMCDECWRAERKYVDLHLSAEEIDPAFWSAIFRALGGSDV